MKETGDVAKSDIGLYFDIVTFADDKPIAIPPSVSRITASAQIGTRD